MGWDKGRYYTRSRKVNGRVIRQYVGGGEVGRLAALLDALKSDKKDAERERWRLEKEQMDAIDEAVEEVCRLADIISKAVMVAAGFHNHRGEWRRRRVQKED